MKHFYDRFIFIMEISYLKNGRYIEMHSMNYIDNSNENVENAGQPGTCTIYFQLIASLV